jgi:hypothetical protein
MVLVRMAEDEVVDAGQVRPDRFKVGENPVRLPAGEIVVAARVEKEREVAALDEDGEPRTHVDHVDLVGSSRGNPGRTRGGYAAAARLPMGGGWSGDEQR